MSTNAIIGIVYRDSTVKSVYLHFDGYPESVLPILENHYNTYEKVSQLIDSGSISILGNILEECYFYHRDYGDEMEFFIDMNREEFIEDNSQEFSHSYLFVDGVWEYISGEVE